MTLFIVMCAVYVLGIGPSARLLESVKDDLWPFHPAGVSAVWPIALAAYLLRGIYTVPYKATDRLIAWRKRPALPAAKVVQR